MIGGPSVQSAVSTHNHHAPPSPAAKLADANTACSYSHSPASAARLGFGWASASGPDSEPAPYRQSSKLGIISDKAHDIEQLAGTRMATWPQEGK